jgi:hypothetical protein
MAAVAAKSIAALVAFLGVVPAQRATSTQVRSASGLPALQQALKDASTDSLVLLVASHPDDRYLLPAVWLRRTFGLRIAVLLASRGGGAQNSLGSETGDALDRIRTLEAEAGCAQLGAEVWYLNRPDGGFRRSAEETFGEWGQESTLRDLTHLLRRIRPDAVLTTHHREEQHGHDLALVELLPEAIRMAADSAFATASPPHAIPVLLLGAGSTLTDNVIRVDVDRLDPWLGVTHRRLAYEILRSAHTSPGPPAAIDEVFDAEMRFEPKVPGRVRIDGPMPFDLPSIFDAGRWPGPRDRAEALARTTSQLEAGELAAGHARDKLGATLALTVNELRRARDDRAHARDVLDRLERRIEALERALLACAGIQFEIDVPPGTIAVAGEELTLLVRMYRAGPSPCRWRVEGLDGCTVALQPDGPETFAAGDTDAGRAHITVRVPVTPSPGDDPMAARFRAERFVPPIRLRFHVHVGELEVPLVMSLPIEQRSPVDLQVVPRMLLLPLARTTLQFSVGVVRNSQFPVEGELEVRGAAGYGIRRDRVDVSLRDQRSDVFGFDVGAPADRKPGVDVLRIRMGANRTELPVHKVDVRVPAGLRIGLLRSRDDTLASVMGVGGLGLQWSELSDADLVVADLLAFETIVVDVRALRDRPTARAGFRRLLDFAEAKGKRLVVFYQKDVEFHPAGESFVGAPHLPFQVGKARVTRADAPVTVLLPEHPLLRHPNVIRPGDWDGWEQERALYLPRIWSGQYEELLEIGDPRQPLERGALLYARTVEGEYVYCALSLWRQLKKLHPGAVRLLANLLTPSSRN